MTMCVWAAASAGLSLTVLARLLLFDFTVTAHVFYELNK